MYNIKYKTSGPDVWGKAYGNRNEEQQQVAKQRKAISDRIDKLFEELKSKQPLSDNFFLTASKVRDSIDEIGANIRQPGYGLSKRFNDFIIIAKKQKSI